MHELAAPRDGEHSARQLVARNFGVDPLSDQRQAAGRYADGVPAGRAEADLSFRRPLAPTTRTKIG